MTRRIFSLLAAMLLFGMTRLTVFAHEVPDLERTDCSIEIVVRYDGKAISGGTLTAFRVGTAAEEDGNFSFHRVHDGAAIENVHSASAAAELEAFVRAREKEYAFETHTASVQNGKAVFSGLCTGLYLIIQEVPAEGYHALNAFLVGVPYVQEGKLLYNITAVAKTEPAPAKPLPTPPPDQLIQTGQLNWPIPLLAAAGLILLIWGLFLQFRQKKEKNGQ